MDETLKWEIIKVLESCEAKLEYLGREFSKPNFTDRYADGPDCLHRAAKARNIITTLMHAPASTRALKNSSTKE